MRTEKTSLSFGSVLGLEITVDDTEVKNVEK